MRRIPLRSWSAAFPSIRPGAGVASSDIVDFIEHELRDSHSDPANVVIEITETAPMGTWRRAKRLPSD